MITNDEVFDALADIQRRQLLVHLLHDDPLPVPRLSSVSREMIRAHETLLREYLSDSREISKASKADIRTHHVHLPKLAEYGYITWLRDAHMVTKGPDFDEVRPVLEVVDDDRDERAAEGAEAGPKRRVTHLPRVDAGGQPRTDSADLLEEIGIGDKAGLGDFTG